jgi:fatty-acyl-CoA synthase
VGGQSKMHEPENGSAASAQQGGTALEGITGALARFSRGVSGSVRVALQHEDQLYSYADLARAISGAGHELRARGINRGQHIALLMENCPEYVVWYLAALTLGNPVTPLNTKNSVSDLAFTLGDADVGLVVYSSGMAAVVESIARSLPEVIAVASRSCWRQGQRARLALTAQEPVALSPFDIAKITYTGGSTGRPKGVIQTHEMLRQCVLMELAEWPWPRSPRFIAVTPLSHAAGFFILPTLMLGGTIITCSRSGIRDLAAEIRRTEATVTFLVPTLIHAFLAAVPDAKRDLASLEMIVYGGSPIGPPDLEESIRMFPGRLVQLYGQTESPMILATLRPEDHDLSVRGRARSCGLPCLGVTLTIRDDEGRELAVGGVGEICARGPLVMPRYWKRPDETATALRGGWLHTGDLGVKDNDGYITVVGRKKDMVITGGFNVYPREVEDALLSHPDVLEAVAFGVPDPTWGEKLVALVVARSGATVDASELTSHVREKKGPVQTPKEIRVVDGIPLTPVGKPDKVGLRRQWPGSEAG